jgi:hypothetical protein
MGNKITFALYSFQYSTSNIQYHRFCRPSPGLLFIISLKPALTRRPTELPPLKPGLRIRLACGSQDGAGRNGLRRGEECALRMVKNAPAVRGTGEPWSNNNATLPLDSLRAYP